MSTIHVPNLQSYYFAYALGELIVFPADRHRTAFAMENDTPRILYVWIGSNPDPDVNHWFTIETTFAFREGVYGPVYVVEQGGAAGDVKVLSSILETPEFIPAIEILTP